MQWILCWKLTTLLWPELQISTLSEWKWALRVCICWKGAFTKAWFATCLIKRSIRLKSLLAQVYIIQLIILFLLVLWIFLWAKLLLAKSSIKLTHVSSLFKHLFENATYLADIGDFCGETALNYKGFCIGTVDSQDTNACDVIFAEGSQQITINSRSMQSFLECSFNRLKIEDRDSYKIGLTSVGLPGLLDNITGFDWSSEKPHINMTFEWTAGKVPITYGNFKNLITDTLNKSIEYCVSLNSYDFRWSAYPCSDKNTPRATLCQIGKS